ncbi:unnamed protein product [Aphanomyces euteiches]|uniref:Uncharacterized protein n=1 Tax=Aphanomyces euteiches TaxID=100861 RepID=A0A6G0XPV6_9STRA|nr:hypothetical protein Ae201684_002650 [Aphanomyces euteiches]KAH9105100.1 hypothetical protein AeMF1_018991 [Aphanomyces euteiches]KAH9121112.1 hypothetical protein LEN26_010798 [Aphanomyces euteiches]KAH9135549.1 hypothetical protein AeRB84_019063 [Aphanomyces euteiches]KAH9193267.1 hypothetical protein AeNC1_004748 [Aphanomyces euteiches]
MSLHVETKFAAVDLTLRTPSNTSTLHERPFAVPECDDDDDSSDSDRELEDHAVDDDDGNQAAPPVDFKWDGVGEIQALKLQNSELVATIKDLKRQVAELEVLLEGVEPIPGLDINSLKDVLQGADIVDHDIRDVKIVHMAKKLRQTKVTLTKERNKAAGASSRIAELEQALHQAQEDLLRSQRQVHKLQLGEKPSEPKIDLSSVVPVKKFDELRVKFEAQTIELKKTQRALQREVGEDVPLAELLDGESGKRGRAQQIVMLKAKVKKLEKELQTRAVPDTGVDAKAEMELQSLKVDKQKQLDQVTSDLNAFKEATDKLSRKYDAQKARVQVLEKEATKNKTKITLLLEKSKNDDALIDALQNELEDLQRGRPQPPKGT